MVEHSEFWVIQRELDPKSKEVPLYELPDRPEPAPPTVLVKDEDLNETLKSRPLEKIFTDSRRHTAVEDPDPDNPYYWGLMVSPTEIEVTEHKHSLEVNEEVARRSGIASGDKVRLTIDHARKLVTITAVNGVTDPEVIKGWPRLESLEADYPSRPLWIEQFGQFNLRVMTLLAPIGFGQNLYIMAPGRVGKTEILLEIWDSLLRMTRKMGKLHVLLAFIGERDKDVSLYTKIYRRLMKKGLLDPDRVETFIAPKSAPAASQFTMFQLALQAAKRRAAMGKDAVLCNDSLPYAAGAHSFGGFAKSGEGMVPGGLYVESIQKVGQMMGPAGQYEFGGSLTFLSSVLEPTGDKRDPAVARFAVETEDNVPDSTWKLLKHRKLGWPKCSVDTQFETMTRRLELFVPADSPQWVEMDEARKFATTIVQPRPEGDGSGEPIVVDVTDPLKQHPRWLLYARKKPIPGYVQSAGSKVEVVR